jgi:hypothetical protein
MNLTREYFDKALKNFASKADLKKFATKDDLKKFVTKDDIKNLITKDDLNDRFEHQTRLLMAYTDQQTENLAAMVAAGFEDIKERLDVRERVTKLEKEVKKIKETAHV